VTPGSSPSQPTDQQTGQTKKLHPKGYIIVCTRSSNVCTFHEMYVAICALNKSYTALNMQVCKKQCICKKKALLVNDQFCPEILFAKLQMTPISTTLLQCYAIETIFQVL
jgi:hypothetical protein